MNPGAMINPVASRICEAVAAGCSPIITIFPFLM
ncbi:uncharacterized protein METZ01_LOCUS490840 [marine metagenome]|uniref:Uncharacterized protein n=1 Tax=marine metagenome TaxID=408172 RepID=A0A383D0B7_9ZZZZ